MSLLIGTVGEVGDGDERYGCVTVRVVQDLAIGSMLVMPSNELQME